MAAMLTAASAASAASAADLPRSAQGRSKASIGGRVGGDETEMGQTAKEGHTEQAKASTVTMTVTAKEAGAQAPALQQQGPVGIDAACGGAAGTAGADGDHDHDQDCRHSPHTPTSPLYPVSGATATAGAAGARQAAATTSSSLRPSSRGMVARSFSGSLQQHQQQSQQQHHQLQQQRSQQQQEQWQREDRSASLGDRYKGNSVFRHHQRQQHYRGSGTGNKYPPHRRAPAREGSRGVISGPGISKFNGASSRMYSASTGATGDVGAATASSGGRRRSRGKTADRDRNSGWDGDGDGGLGKRGDEGEGKGAGEQQGNGRVAQIAESLLWVQKHPVLAAVIWMCGKVLDPGSEATQQDSGNRETRIAATHAGVEGEPSTLPEQDQRRRRDDDDDGEGDANGYAEDSSDPWMGGGVWGGPSGDFEKGRVVPPGFWKRHSKGRLSWSDDYQGGCLAEYYEDERTRMASNSSSVPPCDTDAGDGGSGAADTGKSNSSSGFSHAAVGPSAANARRIGIEGGHADGASRGWGGTTADAAAAKQAADVGYHDDDDHDDEVFHSALQLAGESELEGVGGCAALVHRDTCYGDVREDAHKCEKTRQNSGREGAFGKIANGDVTPSHHTRGAPAGRATAVDVDTGVGLELSGNDSGTPYMAPHMTNNMGAAVSPGTWSPQWGWYVTMTPPQDQYPAEQNPVPGVNAKATASAPTHAVEASDPAASSSATPASIKGRPPRP
eukprot:g15003.t1